MPSRLPVTLSIHEALSPIEGLWRNFEQHAHCTVFQTFEWLAAWHRHIGALANANVAVVMGRQSDDELLFLFPLAVEIGRVRRLTWLGSDVSDYNAPLLSPEFSNLITPDHFLDIWRRICTLLQRRADLSYDVIDLTKMPQMIGAQPNPFLQLGTHPNPSGAHIAHLSGSWDDFYASKRSSSARKRDRNTARRLAEYGEVRIVTPRDAHDAIQTVTTLFEQKAQWFERRGIADAFARPGYREFFLDLASSETTRHLVHVSRLDIGQMRAATSLGLTFRGTYYHVLCSYQAGEICRLGTGNAHLRELLRYSIDRGLKCFDFTTGDEAYKLNWSDTNVELYDHVSCVAMREWPLVAAFVGIRRLKRFLKQTPVLWRAYCRVRAALAPMLASAFRIRNPAGVVPAA